MSLLLLFHSGTPPAPAVHVGLLEPTHTTTVLVEGIGRTTTLEPAATLTGALDA